MKTCAFIITIILIFCGFVNTSCSQKQHTDTDTTYVVENFDPSNIHFQFMGIPIHGTLEQFTKALENKNFYKQDYGNHYGEYWGKFFDGYAYVKVNHEDRNNLVYEVEVLLENYSASQRKNILDELVKKYTNQGAYVMADTGGDYEIIIWTPEGEISHPEYDRGEISSDEIKGVIVFENDGNNLILRYIDGLNKTLHFALENDNL